MGHVTGSAVSQQCVAAELRACMPQTPSFFIQRGLSLYTCLAGQRLSLRSGAAAATQPVVRPRPIQCKPFVVISSTGDRWRFCRHHSHSAQLARLWNQDRLRCSTVGLGKNPILLVNALVPLQLVRINHEILKTPDGLEI